MGEIRSLKAAQLRAWERYMDARDAGLSVEAAARKARISPSSAYRFERGDQSSGGLEAAAILGRNTVAGNLVNRPLSGEAQKALEDFAFFRLRYFGRKSEPWQERAAYDLLRYLQTQDREYVVINSPPGSGKSTLFTHDIPCWLIARDRSIRIMIGSRTERQARMYVGRIKRSLERDVPMRADAESLALGISQDAVACLSDDFGAFKPEGRTELWRADQLVVRQIDGVSLDDKEPTVSAWGRDSGFLGGRFDFVVWDDLVDRKNTKGSESKTDLREWWSTEAETRLEPGGVLVLQGQRIMHDDLYRSALDMVHLDGGQKYRHIVFKVHDEEKCVGHEPGQEMRAWPNGCLLDPHRLPWKFLETIKQNTPRVFEVQYQQEDGDSVGGLVEPEWIKGGVDSDGFPAPGCLDRDRVWGLVPDHLTNGRGWSFVTVDPSPSEFWGIIWWVYDPETNYRYAIDLYRQRMAPHDFLTEDLRVRSNLLGAPITHIVVEVNAAQKWLLSQPHVQRWMDATGVIFVPHTTHINKADPKYGVESIGDLFRRGLIRLPNADVTSRLKTAYLVDEALKYPDSDTTDMVMSTWFGKLAVENIFTPSRGRMYVQQRPGFMKGAQRGLSYSRRGLSHVG
jgi:hypothetical protein